MTDRTIQPERLEALANEIDNRLSPIPGRQADTIATLLRRVAAELHDERMEHDLLKELLSRPEIDDFQDGVMLESAHQRQRWGDAHDRSKSAENWYWLVGYLAGKALRSTIEGDQVKARHHTISSAAVLFQWWKAIAEAPNGVGADVDLAGLEMRT
jgi:hypothetical protein